jgi:hypothetical protein
MTVEHLKGDAACCIANVNTIKPTIISVEPNFYVSGIKPSCMFEHTISKSPSDTTISKLELPLQPSSG